MPLTPSPETYQQQWIELTGAPHTVYPSGPVRVQRFACESVDSTNAWAKRLIAEEAITSLAYLVARQQTDGKGTRGRSWSSPPGAGIYLTLVHRFPAFTLPVTPLYPLAAGVGCVEALQRYAGVTCQLKPINDIYVEGGKLGGILTESVIQDGEIKALMTGIGINVLPAERVIRSDASVSPIALAEVLFPQALASLEQEALIREVVWTVHQWYQVLFAGNAQDVVNRWKAFQLPGTALPADWL
jgi:BirA family biotin operon repressor/biotin-[acetyl-CoA-carboxylase] ligase